MWNSSGLRSRRARMSTARRSVGSRSRAIQPATGNIGRPLIDLLLGEGAKVRAVTRSPQAAGLPAGVEVAEGDPSRPDTISRFLEGVTGLFVNPRSVGVAVGDLLARAQAPWDRPAAAHRSIRGTWPPSAFTRCSPMRWWAGGPC